MKLLAKNVVPAAAIVSLILAGFLGSKINKTDEQPFLNQALPSASNFTMIKGDTGSGHLYSASNGEEIIGWVSVTTGNGYGGPMLVVVGWSPDGTILGVAVPVNQEDKAWFDSLYEKAYFKQYVGRHYTEALKLSEDINAVSGSTVSSRGVAQGVTLGRSLVSQQLGHPYPVTKEPIRFSFPEISVLVGLALVLLFRTLPFLKQYRWLRFLTLAYGLGILGIWLVIPLSLTNFASMALGNFASWQNHLWIYLLTFGTLGLLIVLGKNFYCYWLCPFSAIQEGLHSITKVSIHPPPKWVYIFRNLKYFILWLPIFLALILHTSTVTVFEPWNTLFPFVGSIFSWLLLLTALVAALAIRNPWCNYACPVGTILELTLKFRRSISKLWQKKSMVSRAVRRV